MITIFTPTYNRANVIIGLYTSLVRQTCKEFEWIVVDDGSIDNTEKIIKTFIQENVIKILYIKQVNGGKHRAINRGIKEAKGELFFIVDSDDYITDNALERITFHYDKIKKDKSFAGVCGVKAHLNGEKVGGEEKWSINDCNSLDFRFKYKSKGDMAEVYRTEILRAYPFPDYNDEKYCAESLIWNRIAKNYKMRYFYEKIYICDYLPDGLSNNSINNRIKSPNYAVQNYRELLEMNVPFRVKIRAALNYWRFSFYISRKISEKIFEINIIYVILLPISWFICLLDKKVSINNNRKNSTPNE